MAFKRISMFKWWVQKTMPAIYDDSLSYYELLSKVVHKLSEMIDIINEQSAEIESLRSDYQSFTTNITNIVNNAISEMNEMYEEFTTNINASFDEFRTQIENRITQLANDLDAQYTAFVNTVNHNFAEFTAMLIAMFDALKLDIDIKLGNLIIPTITYSEDVATVDGALMTTSNFVANTPNVLDVLEGYKGYQLEIPMNTTLNVSHLEGYQSNVVGAFLSHMEQRAGDLSLVDYRKEILFYGHTENSSPVTEFEWTLLPSNYSNDGNSYFVNFIVPLDTDIHIEYQVKLNEGVNLTIDVTAGGDVTITGATWEQVRDACVWGKPIVATVTDLEDSLSLIVNLNATLDPATNVLNLEYDYPGTIGQATMVNHFFFIWRENGTKGKVKI